MDLHTVKSKEEPRCNNYITSSLINNTYTFSGNTVPTIIVTTIVTLWYPQSLQVRISVVLKLNSVNRTLCGRKKRFAQAYNRIPPLLYR